MSKQPTTTDLEWTDLDKRAVDTVRVLAMDSVQKVGNGHPGTAMSLAPAAYLLFQKLMRHDPADADWTGRDRFVLSAGHSSLTLYTQLYLAGYGLELDDLKAFRTWGSKTPGHPEYGHTTGVETTTGPLGQGVANAVGMAMAARYERGLFDPDAAPGSSPFDHTIWAIAGDGCLQEGISAEASSMAGPPEARQPGAAVGRQPHLHRGRHRDRGLRGHRQALRGVRLARPARAAQGRTATWTPHALYAALLAAKAETGRPSFIAARSIIAWPAPHAQNTGAAHGSALGEDEVRATKEVLGFDPDQHFEVSDEVIAHTRAVGERGREARAEWEKSFAAWRTANPERAATVRPDRRRPSCRRAGRSHLPAFETGKSLATRAASGKILEALGAVIPELWGGSADLAGLQQHHDRQELVVPARGQPAAGREPVTAAPCTSASASTRWPRR